MKIRVFPIAFATIFFLVHLPSNVFGQCRSVAGGTWAESGGVSGTRTYNLSQNLSSGSITGTTYRAICQTPTWPVSGQFNAGGTSFTLTATNPSPGDPTCTAAWYTLEYSLSLPGCQQASGSWTNSSGQSGDDEMNKPCDVPTGESISTGAWGPAFPTRTHHGWIQILSALNPEINFGGRGIIEEFPSNGTDGCYFAGSMFDQTINPDAGAWLVGTVNGVMDSTLNIWGGDYIGWDEDAVNYYQVERPLRGLPPNCNFTTTQRMSIACDPGLSFYKSGVISAGIDSNSVNSSRHSLFTSKNWP